jgi:cation diffusion facilitator CzcD-associated flavoprotein CzcO
MSFDSALDEIVQKWLTEFGRALAANNPALLAALFREECYWRDQIAVSWNMQQFAGRAQVVRSLHSAAAWTKPGNFTVDPQRPGPARILSLGQELIEAYFRFDMPHGSGQGIVRLVRDAAAPSGAIGFAIGTDLASLVHVVEAEPNRVNRDRIQPRFPIHGYAPAYRGQQFAEFLHEKMAFKDKDPDVLIIGGGHTGLCVGARLERMGQSYLIVDRDKRVGDSWRVRYETLALHTIGAVNQLPYIQSPGIFPDFIPKDVWADWIEAYAKLMQLNMWMETELVTGTFQESRGEWEVNLRRGDGSTRIMRPKHLVLATGGIGMNPRPFLYRGSEKFKGKVIHSKYYTTGADFTGQRVLVVGCGTSAFDMCLDLALKGAHPTMFQRSESSVVPLEEGVRYNIDYLPGGKFDVDTADLRRGVGAIYPLLVRILQIETRACNERNAEMYAALRKAGLWLGDGPDGTGFLGKLFRTFKGFHYDMGVVEEILSGNVKIQQAADVESFVESGVLLKNGIVVEFDAIIAATGFQNSNEDVVQIFGSDIAKRVGGCSGLDESGEPVGLAKPVGQRQFWQLYGGVNDCRRLSRHLALQIIAQLRGVVAPLERQADGSVKPVEIVRKVA